MTSVKPRAKYMVAYIGVDLLEGVTSGWAPFATKIQVDTHVKLLDEAYDTCTVFVSKITEQHE